MNTPRMTPVLAGAIAGASLLTWSLSLGLALQQTQPALAVLVLALFWISALMLVASALTALAGMRDRAEPDTPAPVAGTGRTAILWLLCGEDPRPVATRIAELRAGLVATGQIDSIDQFVLSDTTTAEGRAAERAAFAALLGQGRIIYRNRTAPTGRKPGNVADWLTTHGDAYQDFLLLDADSGFSAARLAQMRAQMAANPRLGLVQTAMRLRAAQSRLGAMQRLSARLSGPIFARGLARVSGDTGNFWGHNALIRVAAFAQVAPLPDLPGRAPWGGPILSHDFIEAAFLRRAGWDVAISPDTRGSFEDAPEDLAGYLRRDRRWSQGNLQHLRLLGAPGLHPVSRMHIGAGIMAYLMAPVWLALVLLMGSGSVHAGAGAIWALVGIMALLMVPKLAGLIAQRRVWARKARRRVLVRALWAELALTTVFAPLAMIQRTGFVLAVLAGRSAGWVPSGVSGARGGAGGRMEQIAGLALLAGIAAPQGIIAGPYYAALATALVTPVVLPLLLAPILWRWFDAPHRREAAVRASDRARDVQQAGTGNRALASHRPLWADGILSDPAAAAQASDLIAQAAEQALGRAPARVVDIGCGAGGTLCHLAQRWPEMQARGITLSAEQGQSAQGLAQATGVGDRVQVLRADVPQPTTLPQADLVIAVETHVHAPSAEDVLRAASRLLDQGGLLVVVDDMLGQPEPGLPQSDVAHLDQFRRGLHLGQANDPEGLVAQARSLGFAEVARHDLTALLRQDHRHAAALPVAGAAADRPGLAQMPLSGTMSDSPALTSSDQAGAPRYTLLVLRKGTLVQRLPEQAVA